RFAGNEKAVAYQIEQSLIHLKNSLVRSTEVLTDDATLWRTIAAMPVEHQPSFATRVLPAQVAESIRSLDREGLWQAGVADGRVRMLEQATPKHDAPNHLNKRIKQQLDPLNVLPW